MVGFFWSRTPGKFVDKVTGVQQTGGSFTGTVREWYETLIVTMIDVQNTVLRDKGTLSMNFISWRSDPVTYPIVECSVLHKPMTGKMIGVIGSAEGQGMICNVPICGHDYLRNTGILQLMQFDGSDAQQVLGAVTILDFKIT